MVFKLVRVDVEEPSKIQLKTGKHIIGRGKFLHIDDDDKRVSRNHAELEVTDDSLTLKALHQNPCFYIKTNTVDTEILQQNSTISLSNGDKFGLIPDNFWYEVIHSADVPEDSLLSVKEGNKEKNLIDKSDKDMEDTEQSNVAPDSNTENEAKCKNDIGIDKSEKEIESKDKNIVTPDSNIKDEAIDFEMSEGPEDLDRSASPSLLNPVESTGADAGNTETYDAAPSTPNKRSHDSTDSSPVDVKKVKIEPVDIKPNAQNVQPGPSNDQVSAEADSTDQKPVIVPPMLPPQPPAPMRERCIYGASCYRRNPQHAAQFSHPADADWGAGPRGVCPYGAACRKREPRHWQTHDHPHGVLAPDPALRRPGQRKNQRKKKRDSNSDDDSSDSVGSDLIVAGKRVRKTVKRDGWLDTQSDEDEDPYATDGSDEWQPSSDVTSSGGFSQQF